MVIFSQGIFLLGGVGKLRVGVTVDGGGLALVNFLEGGDGIVGLEVDTLFPASWYF